MPTSLMEPVQTLTGQTSNCGCFFSEIRMFPLKNGGSLHVKRQLSPSPTINK